MFYNNQFHYFQEKFLEELPHLTLNKKMAKFVWVLYHLAFGLTM